jgi:hypothetical protein
MLRKRPYLDLDTQKRTYQQKPAAGGKTLADGRLTENKTVSRRRISGCQPDTQNKVRLYMTLEEQKRPEKLPFAALKKRVSPETVLKSDCFHQKSLRSILEQRLFSVCD